MTSKNKIVSILSLKRRISSARAQGKSIVFTNGCFDILHYGHISYLEQARGRGHILVVGLNSDASIRRIKGPGRPVNCQENRAGVLAALACVDFVTIFDEDTPYELIKAVRPDVLVKGADWKGREVVGSDLVKEAGGRVELIRYLPGLSTTRTIGKIRRGCQP